MRASLSFAALAAIVSTSFVACKKEEPPPNGGMQPSVACEKVAKLTGGKLSDGEKEKCLAQYRSFDRHMKTCMDICALSKTSAQYNECQVTCAGGKVKGGAGGAMTPPCKCQHPEDPLCACER